MCSILRKDSQTFSTLRGKTQKLAKRKHWKKHILTTYLFNFRWQILVYKESCIRLNSTTITFSWKKNGQGLYFKKQSTCPNKQVAMHVPLFLHSSCNSCHYSTSLVMWGTQVQSSPQSFSFYPQTHRQEEMARWFSLCHITDK